MAGWINIPLKRSDGVDFKKPLEKFIKNTFSAEVATENEDAIAELTKLRNTCVMQTLDKHESALEPLLRWDEAILLKQHFCWLCGEYRSVIWCDSDTWKQLKIDWYDCSLLRFSLL